ncbi:hypothetical protein HI914_03067 [Erysiphe necator]|uniref:Putative perilipin mpl1-like protein n=1 Tax=Uncinula necator TaxID=52586 RepID=A0A0B1P1B5_UNCNE|nr:hypothetical protein HI914_03067 [Erysiphe necator]KHJ30701.1 putative perilipin mpl1-like protein [Erysiphe necator]
MPHFAEANDMSSQLNGESRPNSAFLSHLKSYPIVSDGITTFTSNPYGAKSLSLTTSSYEKISKPLLPYLRMPIAYISPYAARADSIGNSTLSSLEEIFPVVKKPTGELIEEGKSVVFFPLRKGCEGRDYVKGVFGSEKKKFGDAGLINYGKAALATSLVISSDALNWLNGYLAAKTDQAKEIKKEKLGN